MILLLVDECYAFDYLAILQIKKEFNKSLNENSWIECFNFIKNQLNYNFEEIINSPEYNNLYKANSLTFDAVEKARTGKPITAKEVDDLNMQRYNAKLALQNKFFPQEKIRETKS